MLPPSPLTDPDVQNYRFRFFMEELHSRMLSLTPSVTRRPGKATDPAFGSRAPEHSLKPGKRISEAGPVHLCQKAHERRVAIKHAQDLVATAIRYFEQHAVNTCFAVGREYGLVCRCIEHRD
jgi:hypothetical protein